MVYVFGSINDLSMQRFASNDISSKLFELQMMRGIKSNSHKSNLSTTKAEFVVCTIAIGISSLL